VPTPRRVLRRAAGYRRGVRRLLVLWDIDFTLIGASGVGQRLYGMVFQDMFGRELPGIAPMAGRTDRAIILDTLTRAGIGQPREQVDRFIARLAAMAPARRELAAGQSLALPGAVAALTALARYAPPGAPEAAPAPGAVTAPGPVPLCVVQSVLTGNVRQLAEVKLSAAGLASHLDLGVGAYGEAHEVRAELVHLARRNAARRYGADFSGEQTVLVGDTELDVAAALATGARVVGVATGSTTADKLAAAGADAVLPDLTDTEATLAAILGNSSRPAASLPATADSQTVLSATRASCPGRPQDGPAWLRVRRSAVRVQLWPFAFLAHARNCSSSSTAS
jgi:phosphoglycolate phosphatase